MNVIKTVALIMIASGLSVWSAVSAADTPDLGKPVLGKDGRIVCGAKSIKQAQLRPPYQALTVCLDNDNLCYAGESFDLGAGELNPVFFLNAKEELIGNSTVLVADARASTSSKEKLGTYKLSLIFLENGLAKVESQCTLDNPAVLKKRYFIFRIPEYMNLSGEYTREGKTVALDAKPRITFSGDDLKGLKIVFFPKDDQATFAILPDQCSSITLNNNVLTVLANTNGIMSFLLDIRGGQGGSGKSELAPNGINVWDVDKLHFPDYGACSNLVQNPSFEAGLRYWAYRTFAEGAIPLKHAAVYELDGKEAHSGLNSLRIKALPFNNPLPLGTYPLPFVPGEKYTLSFYAKGAGDKPLSLWVEGRGQSPNLFERLTFEVGKEWKRYSAAFVPKEKFAVIYFRAKLAGDTNAAEGVVWLDDIQVDKGEMTGFVQPPLAAELQSAARGNFLEFGQPPDLRLAIQALPGARGAVALSVEDFFFRKIFEHEYAFAADAKGKALVSLEALNGKIAGDKLRGLFSVTAAFKIDGIARPFNDYFRFSVMNFLENKHKNKNIFNLTYQYSLQAGGPDMERFVERERAIGIGSIAYEFISSGIDMEYALDEERVRLLEKYGFDCLGGRPVQSMHGKTSKISEENGTIVMDDLKNRVYPSDEELAVFENICAVKAKNRSWNKMWFFSGESNPGMMPLESHPESFAKFLLATLRGVKKGNPEAKVLIEGGPWTIAPDAGGKWMERYIQDTKKLDPSARFDGAAGHFYCNFPEQYDLDVNIGEFIKMLDRNGHGKWPVYLSEGGNYCPISIPSEGLSPYVVHSGNPWYIAPLSYHMGRAERISAAFSARNWLAGLKYQDNVKIMNDFMTPNRYMDIDFTPRAFDKIPNTLGRILGDASFYRDIRFAPDCRCYVFKDDKTGAPIAAIWGHKESVDRWKQEPPVYRFDFGKQDLTFIDLMENEVNFSKNPEGNTLIPMSPFPLFIKGTPGTEQKLCDAIAAAVPATGSAGGVEVSAFPNAEGKATVVFKNTFSREYSDEAKIVINGVENKWPLKIPSLGSREEQVALAPAAAVPDAAADGDGAHRPPIRNDGGRSACPAKPLGADGAPTAVPNSATDGALQKFTAEYAFAGGNTGKIAGDYILLKNQAGITVDGDLSDWQNLPVNDLGAGLSMQAVMADKKIIIALRATGKNLSAEDVFSGVGLYLDPFEKTDTWAEPKTAVGGIAGDLGVYEIQKSKDGGLEALCRFSQGTLAGMDKDLMIVGKVQKLITVKTAMSGDVACMEIEVPEKIFAPLTLAEGSRFGLNISVPLKEGGVTTLAPMAGFKSAAEPGKINFVMIVIGK